MEEHISGFSWTTCGGDGIVAMRLGCDYGDLGSVPGVAWSMF